MRLPAIILMLACTALSCTSEELPPEKERTDRIVDVDTGQDDGAYGEAAGEGSDSSSGRVALCMDLECRRDYMAYPWGVSSDSRVNTWYGMPVRVNLSLVSWNGGGAPDTSTVLCPFNLTGARLNADLHIHMEPLEGYRFYGAARDAVKNALGSDSDDWKALVKRFALGRMAFRADGEPVTDLKYDSTKRITEDADALYHYCNFWRDGGKEHPADTVLWETDDLYVGSLIDAFLPLESYEGDVLLKEVDEVDGVDYSHCNPVLTDLLDVLQKADDRISRLRTHKWRLFGSNFGWGDADGGTSWRSFGISLENVSLSGAEGYELTHVIYRFRGDGTPYWWEPVDGSGWAVPVD